MPALGEYVNVYNTALVAIESKGFQVWYDGKAELFCAEKDGWDFMAENPISLLGLIGIYETQAPTDYGEYWWRRTGPDYQRLPSSPRPYVSVIRKNRA
jgi:hypothetical protein